MQLATIQDLANYWATEYDWRRCEAKLNTLEQFIISIDGLDVHFIHVRSPEQDALPLIVSHGWPGSAIEQLKIIEPLTNAAEHGGSEADAFDVVIPSLPGWPPKELVPDRSQGVQLATIQAVVTYWATRQRRRQSAGTPAAPRARGPS